jgi:small multidrug resistance pump
MNIPIVAWIYLIVAIIAETIATTLLKASYGFTKLWPTLFLIIGYFISFYCLAQVTKFVPLAVTYAIWCGVGIVLITLFSWLFFDQTLDLAGVIGIALIMAGVLMLQLVSKAGHS